MISNNLGRKRRFIARSSGIAAILLAISLPLSSSYANDLYFNNESHLSTLEVIDAAEKKYNARVIKAKRKAKPGFPNCHELKMKTSGGVFKIIRVHCS
jgi:hypothetical protein